MKPFKFIFFLIGILFILSFTTHKNSSQLFSDERYGIWEIPQDQRWIWGDSSITLVPVDIFRYDGTYITMRWISWSWSPYSNDGFYRFKTRWSKDTLQYLSPYNVWTEAAIYKNNTYHSQYIHLNGDTNKWTFRKINETQVIKEDKSVLSKHSLYAYELE
jgi:hypothetical protein